MHRLAMTRATAAEIEAALADEEREQAVFCLLREGRGHSGTRLLVGEVLHPPAGGIERQDLDQLVPSPQWVSAVIGRAIEANAGLLFVHSHPASNHPPGLSAIDRASFERLAATAAGMLDGPVGAAVVHPTGWACELWTDDGLVPVERIWAVGRSLQLLSPPPLAADPYGLDHRQRDALGSAHGVLRGLRIGLVGTSGNGSPIGEQLIRVGVDGATLIEHDVIDTPSNLRRVVGSTASHLRASTPPRKVDVVGGHLDSLGFDTQVLRVHGDVREEETFRHLLDCDVVICATDTHGSRAVLNTLPTSYLLPVIDVGIRVAGRDGGLTGLWSEVRVLTPETPCLWCLNVLDPDRIRAENLPEDERIRLREEGYLPGSVGEPAPSVIPLNFTAAGLACCALLRLISVDGEWAPTSYRVDAMMGDAMTGPLDEPLHDCTCRHSLGQGDVAAATFTG